MLEQEKAFYEAHKTEIIAKYAGKRLVIDGDRIIGSYDTLPMKRVLPARKPYNGNSL